MNQALNKLPTDTGWFPKLTDDFIGMMSHELYTPLNNVTGLADLIASTELSSVQQEYLEQLRLSGKALRRLFGNILDYMYITSGKCSLDCSETDLWSVLEEIRDTYRPIAQSKGLVFSLRLTETRPLVAKFDRDRLRQILGNLVANAVKFTERGAVSIVATLECWNEERTKFRLRIEVQDTGIGFPLEDVENVFEPFIQIDRSRSREHEGAGLGLAICRSLARLMNGDVGVKASSPTGSAFYFVAEFESVPEASPHLRKPAGKRVLYSRVLVVDDHRVNRLLARYILSDVGVTIDEAENGMQCLEMHAQSSYDLIFMDLQMPKIDGIEAARLIRKAEREQCSAKKVRIVAVTAHALDGIRQALLDAGMDDCLNKPLSREGLEPILFENPSPATMGF